MSFRFQSPEKMSYSYLFKYIIIGDTGANMVGFRNILFHFRSWEVLLTLAIHRQAVPAGKAHDHTVFLAFSPF